MEILTEYCKLIVIDKCFECNSGFTTILLDENNPKSEVKCVKKVIFKNNDTYCLEANEDFKCIKCAARMYLNSDRKCVSIDENCNEYNEASGDCLKCYPGYVIGLAKTKNCTI